MRTIDYIVSLYFILTIITYYFKIACMSVHEVIIPLKLLK